MAHTFKSVFSFVGDVTTGFKMDHSFFNLMVEAGQMAKEEKPEIKMPQIVRPASMGGRLENAYA